MKVKIRQIELMNLIFPQVDSGVYFWHAVRGMVIPEQRCWKIKIVALGVNGHDYQNNRRFKRTVLRELRDKAVESYKGEKEICL